MGVPIGNEKTNGTPPESTLIEHYSAFTHDATLTMANKGLVGRWPALRLQPENTEIAGLLALMLLTDARRHARTGPNDELIPLAQQNRALWDREQIADGATVMRQILVDQGNQTGSLWAVNQWGGEV